MVSGQWSVVSGQWSVVSGQWSVVSGQWSVVSGKDGANHRAFWLSSLDSCPGGPAESTRASSRRRIGQSFLYAETAEQIWQDISCWYERSGKTLIS